MHRQTSTSVDTWDDNMLDTAACTSDFHCSASCNAALPDVTAGGNVDFTPRSSMYLRTS